MTMPKYNITVGVHNVQGYQVWELEAGSPEEALELYNSGAGDVVHEELEVCSLDEAHIDNVEEVDE